MSKILKISALIIGIFVIGYVASYLIFGKVNIVNTIIPQQKLSSTTFLKDKTIQVEDAHIGKPTSKTRVKQYVFSVTASEKPVQDTTTGMWTVKSLINKQNFVFQLGKSNWRIGAAYIPRSDTPSKDILWFNDTTENLVRKIQSGTKMEIYVQAFKMNQKPENCDQTCAELFAFYKDKELEQNKLLLLISKSQPLPKSVVLGPISQIKVIETD